MRSAPGAQHPGGLDRATLRFMVDHRTPWLNSVMELLTWLGSSIVLLPASVIVAGLWRWRRHDWTAAWVLAGLYAFATLSYVLLKQVVHRDRPPANFRLVHAAGYAFPSGHATLAAAIWGCLAFLAGDLLRSSAGRATAWAIALVVTGIVGLTRLYLGVHWLSDVVAGWVLGGLWLMVVLAVHRRLSSETSGA